MIKKYLIKYSIEFLVIILGITVSFQLSEITIDNQDEKERIKVLNSLQMENNETREYDYKMFSQKMIILSQQSENAKV